MNMIIPAQQIRRWAALACSALAALSAPAQTSEVLFSDDFDSGIIDDAKWRVDGRPFESGVSDITANAALGVLEFSGTVIEQWWPGSALATIPTFSASMETNLVITVDRLTEFGAERSRSALFITDANRENFVLFADVRNEGGWRYNRKIGKSGDSPNGSGVDIPAFNDPVLHDDGGYHQMQMVANGQTVKLYLDGVLGAEVEFPFQDGIVVQLGSYARATGDTAYTQFDNFMVEAVGAVSFSQQNISVKAGQTSGDVTVRIPNGSNATQPVTVRVVSQNPEIAVPAGAVGGILTLTFPAGGPATQTIQAQGIKSGAAEFTFENDQNLLMANTLLVNVPFPIGTVFQDEFTGPIDETAWEVLDRGFEPGSGDFTASTTDGELVISGVITAQYWGGATLRTRESYVASEDLSVAFEVESPGMERSGTAARRAIFITSEDRAQFVALSQNHGEGGWTVNVNPGNPTGGGTVQTVLNGFNDLEAHTLKLVANGETVTVYVDDVPGGTFPFPVQTGIHFEIGAYARANNDTVTARFDNAHVFTILPCTEVIPVDVTIEHGVADGSFRVQIPRLLNETDPATVTIISQDPAVAVPTGASGGSLTLTFAAGATNVQTVGVTTVSPGLTVFDVIDNQGGCVASAIDITVTPALLTLTQDDFSGAAINETLWTLVENSLEGGTLTNSTAVQTGGEVQFHVTPVGALWWPGYVYRTVDAFSASALEPLIFEVDRVSHEGSGASTRTGVWITDASRDHWVFFSFDDNFQGWQYNRQVGVAGDNPLPANGVNILAFDAPEFHHGGNVRMKVIADGQTAKLYLDGVLGAELPFPVSNGIHFEFGAYARTERDVLDASFDNAVVRGPMPCISTDVANISIPDGGANAVVTVRIPRLLNADQEARVTVTSSNPAIAAPEGASDGSLTLVFPAGGAVEQSFEVRRGAPGIARLSLSTPEGLCALSDVTVTALAPEQVFINDSFDGTALDTSEWAEDGTPFETGAVDPIVTMIGGAVDITATGTSNYWGGHGITTVETFTAGPANPLTFEIDRTYLIDNGSTGVRSAFWILSGTNWVMFADLVEGGLGWTYNRNIGQEGDVVTGGGVNMTALDGGAFDDRGLHRVRLVANGSTVRFYVDDVLGAEVPFPFSSGIQFRFGAYTRAEFDLVSAGFANAVVRGSDAPVTGAELQITRSGTEVAITWEGAGTLQQTDALDGTWEPVANANSPYTVEASGTAFYRVVR